MNALLTESLNPVRSPAASTPTSVTSARPIIRADAVETNFVAIDLAPLGLGYDDAEARAKREGVQLDFLRPGVMRAVTHLDVSDEDIDRAIERIPVALGVRSGVGV